MVAWGVFGGLSPWGGRLGVATGILFFGVLPGLILWYMRYKGRVAALYLPERQQRHGMLLWGSVWYFAGFALLWVLPLCTWHITIQYMRLIAEHSAVSSEDPAYQGTRTTIPTRLEALLILPRNIGYHLEHHWYPSVPFYRLPELHARLMREPRFAANADVSTSILRSLVHVTHREAQ